MSLAVAGRATGQGTDAANINWGDSGQPTYGDAPDGTNGEDADTLVAAATAELTIDRRTGADSDMSADDGDTLAHQCCDDVDMGDVGGVGGALGVDGSQRSDDVLVRLAGDSESNSGY